MAKYTESQVEVLRQTPIIEVLRVLGKDTRHTPSGLFHSPFREDKNASFHIDEKSHRWSDPGDFDPRHIKPGRKQAGGDVIDLVQWMRGCAFSEALDFLATMNPGIVGEELPSHTTTTRRAVNQTGTLAGYVNHSGGAIGSDSEWGDAGALYGVRSNHYWHGRKTPAGNVELSEEEYREGVEHVNKANLTMRRRPEKYMDLLARNWFQVRNADAVFAIGNLDLSVINKKGGKEYSPVAGGTGWAVQMAIDNGKPVYLFDQDQDRWFSFTGNKNGEPVGWSALDEAPVLTRNFAGIGTRELAENGRNAIRAAYLATLRNVQGITTEKKRPLAHAAPSGEDDYMLSLDRNRRINIWFGSGENAILSNLAIRPFGQYNSVEQAFQHRKALYAGDEQAAAAILAEQDPTNIKALGRSVKGLNTEGWNAMAPSVMEWAVRMSFSANPDAQRELLKTGNALLTHTQERSHWKEDFPKILMKTRALMIKEVITDNIETYRGASEIKIEEISDRFQSPRLIDYMTSHRRIPENILNRYCNEVSYSVHRIDGEGTPLRYSAIGFRNRAGEWTLRGSSFIGKDGKENSGLKRSTGNDYTAVSKDGSFIEEEKATCDSMVVFEGFVDFMSWLAWNGTDVPGTTDVVVLNSVANTTRALDFITSHQKIATYLDNDEAGDRYTERIKEAALQKGCRFWDCRKMFAPAKDLNEAWVDKCRAREKKVKDAGPSEYANEKQVNQKR